MATRKRDNKEIHKTINRSKDKTEILSKDKTASHNKASKEIHKTVNRSRDKTEIHNEDKNKTETILRIKGKARESPKATSLPRTAIRHSNRKISRAHKAKKTELPRAAAEATLAPNRKTVHQLKSLLKGNLQETKANNPVKAKAREKAKAKELSLIHI